MTGIAARIGQESREGAREARGTLRGWRGRRRALMAKASVGERMANGGIRVLAESGDTTDRRAPLLARPRPRTRVRTRGILGGQWGARAQVLDHKALALSHCGHNRSGALGGRAGQC